MVIGLLLVLAGAVGIVAAVLTVEGSGVQLLGFDLTALGLFFAGVACSAAILLGIALVAWGSKRSLRRRRESRRLAELDAERRAGDRDRVDGVDETDSSGEHRL